MDVQKIFHQMEQRTLSAAYKFYCNKKLEGAHSAEIDASATAEILTAQLEHYPALGNTIDSILKTIGEEQVVDFARRFVFDAGCGNGSLHLQTVGPHAVDGFWKGDTMKR